MTHEDDLAFAELGRLVFFDIIQTLSDLIRVAVEMPQTPRLV